MSRPRWLDKWAKQVRDGAPSAHWSPSTPREQLRIPLKMEINTGIAVCCGIPPLALERGGARGVRGWWRIGSVVGRGSSRGWMGGGGERKKGLGLLMLHGGGGGGIAEQKALTWRQIVNTSDSVFWCICHIFNVLLYPSLPDVPQKLLQTAVVFEPWCLLPTVAAWIHPLLNAFIMSLKCHIEERNRQWQRQLKQAHLSDSTASNSTILHMTPREKEKILN